MSNIDEIRRKYPKGFITVSSWDELKEIMDAYDGQLASPGYFKKYGLSRQLIYDRARAGKIRYFRYYELKGVIPEVYIPIDEILDK